METGFSLTILKHPLSRNSLALLPGFDRIGSDLTGIPGIEPSFLPAGYFRPAFRKTLFGFQGLEEHATIGELCRLALAESLVCWEDREDE